MAHWTGREGDPWSALSEAEQHAELHRLRGSVWRDVVAPTVCILLVVAIVVLIGIFPEIAAVIVFVVLGALLLAMAVVVLIGIVTANNP